MGKLRHLRFLVAAMGLASLVLPGLVRPVWADPPATKQLNTTYQLNTIKDILVRVQPPVSLLANPAVSRPPKGNTVIVRIDGSEPVKEIMVYEALIINGINEPLLEINGHDTGGSGILRIGELTFEDVDAKEMWIASAKVVHLNTANVVADNNELNIDITAVNEVNLEGGAATLFLGTRQDLLTQAGSLSSQETGLKADRLRILGPVAGVAFVERLVVRGSSVFGKIEIRNVEVGELNLTDVTLKR